MNRSICWEIASNINSSDKDVRHEKEMSVKEISRKELGVKNESKAVLSMLGNLGNKKYETLKK